MGGDESSLSGGVEPPMKHHPFKMLKLTEHSDMHYLTRKMTRRSFGKNN